MKYLKGQRISTLIPEENSYPWQIVQGDSETWVILRWKEKLKNVLITDLLGVSVDRFNWSVDYRCEEKRFYSGEIGLSIKYKATGINAIGFTAKEAGQDEFSCREIFYGERDIDSQYNDREPIVQETAFPFLLLDAKELGEKHSGAGEYKTWQAFFPWRTWLKGKGEEKEPLLVKVHITQTGLYTILVEALIKIAAAGGTLSKENLSSDKNYTSEKNCSLEKKNISEENSTFMGNGTAGEKGNSEGKYSSTVYKEEAIFDIEDDSAEEVLGMPVSRAFWSCKYDKKKRNLFLSDLKKVYIVYISSLKGGERIRVASTTKEEEVIAVNIEKPLYPFNILAEQAANEAVLLGNEKILYRTTNHLKLQMEIEQSPVEKTETIIKPMVKEEPVPVKRPKPCEKWLKDKNRKTSGVNSKMMTIKK